VLAGRGTAGPDDPADPGDTGDGDGGGGPGPGGGPGDKPDRKDCTSYSGEACKDCCYYNFDEVDGWECRKIEREKGKRASGKCWREAAQRFTDCHRECRNRPAGGDGVLTSGD
jgi:hypothetical protein